jgi:DNA-binding MarR family transcriptional regulator
MHKFEKAGFIEKKQCDDDGRVYHISLTKRAKLIAKSNVLESDRAIGKIFATLNDEEIITLKRLFNKIGRA